MINIILFERNDKSQLKFLNKEFRHVHTWLNDGISWIHIDSTHRRLEIKTYPVASFNASLIISAAAERCAKVLMQNISESIEDNIYKIRLFHFMSCVTIAKYVCGVCSSLVITPKQLFNYLIRLDNVERLL